MNESVAQRDPVEQLAEEFMGRLRRGERPAVSEYAAGHPELADEIRDLFPALVMMEEVKPAGAQPHLLPVGADVPPEQLGDYRILREVARGGMGVVYEAEQLALGRHVALKVLPTQADGGPLRLLRFRREARSAARLHHTNIVPVFDVGSADGIHYYAMQFIQGQGLDEVLRELHRLRAGAKPTDVPAADLTVSLVEGLRTGVFAAAPFVPVPKPAQPRPEPSAILTGPVSHYFRSVAGLGVQAAEALAYAHGQRVLHRDVKPSNLLLDRQGTLWLTDFGLAKDDGDDLTRTGDIVGTLRYMAPERFMGISDPRTDVYALGITLYELLTLRPAFDAADRVLLIRQIAQDDPPRPRSSDATIPQDLETIVLRAIEKEPARRYPSAADMADDLKRFLADRPIKARRASWREQAWRWCRRNPGVAASLSAAFGLLLLLVVGLSVGGLLVWRAKQDAEAAHGAAERSLAEAARALYVQRIAVADRDFRANNVARAEELLGLCPEHMRGWEWHYLNRNRGRGPRPLTLPTAVTGRGSLSPDGLRAAVAGTNGTLHLIELVTGLVSNTLQAYPPDSRECLVAFTPNGRLVTADEPATGNSTVKLWDPTTLRQVGAGWEFPHGSIYPFAISPDGQRLVTAGRRNGVNEYRVDVWELSSGRHLVEVDGRHTDTPQELAFSPDGRLVASAAGDGAVRVSDSHTGRSVHVLRHDPRAGYTFWCVAFSPDGRRLAAGYGDERQANGGGVLQWDVATGEPGRPLPGQQVTGVVFGPRGRVFTGGVDGTMRVWDPDGGEELLALRGHTDVTRCLGFTPDGHKLVTVGLDRVVRVWDATAVRDGEHLGDERLTLRDHANGVLTARFLPGGREVVTASSDGTVRRLPVADGTGLATVLSTGEHTAVAIDPGGGTLAVVAGDGRNGHLFDLRTGQPGAALKPLPEDERLSRLVFSPDGGHLVSWSNKTVFVWDLRTGGLRPLPGHNYYVYSAAFRPGPESRLVAVSTAGEVFVWDAKTGKRLAEHQHSAAAAVAFRFDGKRMATTGWDRVVQLWDTTEDDPRKWAVIDKLIDPTGGPNAVAFSPDGSLLAWGGTDSTVKVWKLGTQDVEVLRGHRHWVWDVDFSPDGKELVSASRDGTVKLWPNPFIKR